MVSVGAPGSGAAGLSERVLAAAGLAPDRDIRPVRQTMRDAGAALASGAVDAVMWAGGLPTPAFTDPRVPIALLDLGGVVAALRRRFGPAYEPVRIPAGIRRSPPSGSPTSCSLAETCRTRPPRRSSTCCSTSPPTSCRLRRSAVSSSTHNR
ncbi:hypothetical protein KTR9_1116 [Gordonia sp. KTR9]|nr:hypothetical protein KTR9_1116 [Gordonia sp. KTR9]